MEGDGGMNYDGNGDALHVGRVVCDDDIGVCDGDGVCDDDSDGEGE